MARILPFRPSRYVFMRNNTELLTVEDVARTLDMHVRTVRRFLREGRLKGFKVGKSYRITAADLAALTGQPEPVVAAAIPRRWHAEASVMVQIDAIDPDGAMRVMNALGGATRGRDRHSDIPVRVETVYDEARARLKIIGTGSLATAVGLLQLIEGCTQR